MPRSHPADEPRPIEIVPRFLRRHSASVLYASGETRVLCAASLSPKVPPFLEGTDRGWATAEYSLLPASTQPRAARERSGKLSGRTQEIQRLIGRSLRGVLDLTAIPGRTLQIDCDVIEADGGTRTASINGAYVAAVIAVEDAIRDGVIERSPLERAVGAMSAGMVGGEPVLDLNYDEDSTADVDLNLVLVEGGDIIEIQGTSERAPLSRSGLADLVALATVGIERVFAEQRAAIAAAAGAPPR